MELGKNFQHNEADKKWYNHWRESGYFSSTPDERPPYTIVIPPPNVTGVLHMGHALNNTVQDILIRRAKMMGYNTCWVPGTDHASIATEAKVVNMLKERGIDKNKMPREEFLKYAWEWKEKYGGIILKQLEKLGCSLDWDRTAFTMDDDYYAAVMRVSEIFRDAITRNWPAFILAHNHPSGDPNPSPEDVELTRAIVSAGRMLDITLLDHPIIGHRGWVSLKDLKLGFE